MIGATTTVKKNDSNGSLNLRGGTDSGDCGSLSLIGKDVNSDYAGGFFLSCGKDSPETYKYLIGLPNGHLSWGSGYPGNDLAGSAIVAKSLGTNGYIKYAGGLIMQWGEWSTTNGASQNIDYPISFASKVFFAAAEVFDNGTPSQSNPYCIVYAGLSSLYIHHNYSTRFGDSKWFAIGY